MIGRLFLGKCLCVLFGHEKNGRVKRRACPNTLVQSGAQMHIYQSGLSLPDILHRSWTWPQRVSLVPGLCMSEKLKTCEPPCLQVRMGFLCSACLRAFDWASIKIPWEKMHQERWADGKGGNLNDTSQEWSLWIGLFVRFTVWELKNKAQPTSSGSIPKLQGVRLKMV